MPQVSFPIFALTDKTNFGELPALFTATAKRLTEQKLPNAILLYEICDAPEWAHATVKPATSPGRMLILTYQPAGRAAIGQAIVNAKSRLKQEPPQKKPHLTAKANTPLRNIFKQMAEIPLTEFNLVPGGTPTATLFFLCSSELIAEFRVELPKVLVS
jgi:hypothetical protein